MANSDVFRSASSLVFKAISLKSGLRKNLYNIYSQGREIDPLDPPVNTTLMVEDPIRHNRCLLQDV